MAGGLGRVTHHTRYYFDDGDVSFLTSQGTKFRVHKKFFQRDSQVFRDLFESNADDDPPSDPDAYPFTLDVSAEDFAHFLWVWYDRENDYHEQTKANWLTILHLATRWHFDNIKDLALREIESLELPAAGRNSIDDDHAYLEDEPSRETNSKPFEDGLGPRSSGPSTGPGGQDLHEAHRTLGSTSTNVAGEPQVSEKPKGANQSPSVLADEDGNGSQEKKQVERAESHDVHKEANRVVEGEGEEKRAEDKKGEKGQGEKDEGEEVEGEGVEQKPPENPHGRIVSLCQEPMDFVYSVIICVVVVAFWSM